MRKRLLIFGLILVMAISTMMIGCVDEQIPQDQLAARINAAYQDIETYQADIDLEASINALLADGTSINADIPITGSYLLNLPHKKAKIELSMAMPQELQDAGMPETAQTSIYLIDNAMYINGEQMLGNGSSVHWIKINLSDLEYALSLESQNIIGYLSGLLSGMHEIAVTDKYMIHNTDAYEVSINPDMKQLLTLLLLLQGTGGINLGPLDAAQLDQLLNSIEKLNVKQWFDRGSFEPIRATMGMELKDPQGIISTEVTMDFKNINADIPIELPAGAENAIDLMELLGGTQSQTS